MERYANSVKAIYFGTPDANGDFVPLETLMSSGRLVQKIAEIESNNDDPEYQTIKAKEDRSTITRIMTSEGTTKYTIEVYDIDAETLSFFTGATVEGGQVIFPTSPYEPELAMAIVHKPVDGVSVVRMHALVKVSAHLAGDFSDDNLDRLVVDVEVLTPRDSAGVEKPNFKLEYRPDAPKITSVDTANNTMDFTFVGDFSQASDYEYTTDGGATWTAVSAKPISDTAITAGLSANTLGVRVKAGTSWKTGFAGFYPYAT